MALGYTEITHTVSSELIYRGRCRIEGALTSDPSWQISREKKVGTQTYITYMDSGHFTQIWDNRADFIWPELTVQYDNIYSLKLDGINDYAISSDSTLFNSYTRTNSWSFGGWFKINTSGVDRVLLSRAGTAGNQPGIKLKVNASQQVYIEYYENASVNTGIVLNTVDPITVGAWTHIVLTYGGGSNSASFKIYVNGIQQSTTTTLENLSGGSATYATGFFFGRWNNIYTDCYIDECAFYNANLNAISVAAWYNSGITQDLSQASLPNPTNLIAWYRMGDEFDKYPVVFNKMNTDFVAIYGATPTAIQSDVP